MTSLISAVVTCSSGSVALDFDLFGQALHAEREFEGQGAAHFQNDLVCLRRESGETRLDIPGADAQRRQEEAALAVRDPLHDDAGGDMGGGDRGAGKHAARGVPDHAANFARIDLSRARPSPTASTGRR